MQRYEFWRRFGAWLATACVVAMAICVPVSIPAHRRYREQLADRIAAAVSREMTPMERRKALRAIRSDRHRVTSPSAHAIPLTGGVVVGLAMIAAARKRERDERLQTPDFRARDFTARIPSARYHTFWGRFWAGWLDSFALAPVYALLSLTHLHASGAVQVLGATAQTAAWFAYNVWLLSTRGQTVGKWLCRVKVLDLAEGPLSLRQAALRDGVPLALNLLAAPFLLMQTAPDPFDGLRPAAVVGSIASLWYLVEIVTMLANDKRRALHDFIARSVVVRSAQ